VDQDESSNNSDEDEDLDNRIVNIAHNLLHSSSVCSQCKAGEMAMSETARAGLAFTRGMTCDHCGYNVSSHAVEKSGSYFELNRQSVLAMRLRHWQGPRGIP